MNREEMDLEVEQIRKQYVEKEGAEKKLEELRALDRQVKGPAKAFAYGFGTAGSLVMGTGMCLAMDIIGKKKRIPGVIIGILGMIMMGVNYPIYKKNLENRKKEYAKTILEHAENIFEEEKNSSAENGEITYEK